MTKGEEDSRRTLEIKLLGSPEVWLAGEMMSGFRSGKARALLYYLAVTGRAQPRSVLAGLFWGDVAESQARRSLTMTLSNLRQLVGPYLLINRETIAMDPDSSYWLDAAAFDAGLAAAPNAAMLTSLQQAIDLYRGDFLEGFYIHDAPEFEQWTLVERARLRERVQQALHMLADRWDSQGDLSQAIDAMRRLIGLEPWREEAHRYLMLLLARNGQRSAALAQFEICRRILADELDVEPGLETTELYEAIRTKTFVPPEGSILSSAPVRGHVLQDNVLTEDRHAAGYQNPIYHDQDHPVEPEPLPPTLLPKAPANSILVLPFVNLSADPDNEYFCDGLAEDLINALTHIETLRVVARATAFSFKGRPIDIRHIGEKLQVNTVLEGSVRKVGDRLRIFIQLSSVVDGYHIWSERYDRKMDDVFALQDEITLTVVDKLKIELLKEETQAVVKHYTDNIEAYHLYLRGRYFIYTKKGNDFFKKAIELAPAYALAYAGLADSYSGLGLLAFLPPESFAKAKTAASQALKIDHTLAEAHCSLGLIHFWLNNDWHEAGREFEQAIALNPHYAPTRQWYAVFLVWQGQVDKAIAEVKQAQALDPLSPVTQAIVGFIHYCTRDFEAAVRYGKTALDIDANHLLALYLIALPYKELGLYNEAIAVLQQAVARSGRHAFFLGLLGHIYSISGQSEKARQLLAELQALEKQAYVTPLAYAWIYLGLADYEQAVTWFETAFEAGYAPYHIFLGDSIYDRIRAHPRFKKILRQIGLARWSASDVESPAENEVQPPFVPLSIGTVGPKHNLLPQPTPFVGRERELADIIRRLTDRDCRLLVLVGPGGIGKTRLALETAQRFIGRDADPGFFEHGVLFMPLAAVESSAGLVSAVAEAANFTFYGHLPPQRQLLHYLQTKEMLLVFDNVEHLLPPPQAEDAGAAELIAAILAAAARVKILVTSREALNLQQAWFHPVQGMSFPTQPQSFSATHSPDPASLEGYDALQLFAQSAARARVEFSLAAEQDAVVRICQLVAGMPLAIELAAAWLKSLPAAAIATEIERDLDILTTRHQNVPERHRSMRVVLAQSWQRLTASEREIFKRSSVFRGSFATEAGRRVAGASLIDLATFVEKSLLAVTPAGRYQMHELLRQYAAEQLAESPPDVVETRDKHCTYYADFLQQRSTGMMGGQQRISLTEIAAEYDNVWTAWRWAVKQGNVTALKQSVSSLQYFCQFQGRYLEGANAWAEAIDRLSGLEPTEPVNLTLVELLVWWGWLNIRLGQLDQAEVALTRCRDLYQQLDVPPIPGYGTDPALALSLVATIRGDYDTALHYGEQARRQGEAPYHPHNLCQAHYVLASATLGQGRYHTAQQHAQRALTLAQQIDDRWFTAYCLNELGKSALALADLSTAQEHFQASYTIRREFDDPQGMGVALNYLGEVALQQRAFDRAHELFQESLAIYQNILDKGGLATAHKGLGAVAIGQHNFLAAGQHLQYALRLATEIHYVPLMFSILNVMGQLWLTAGHPERGVRLVAFVRANASHQPAQDEARQILDEYSAAQKELAELLAAVQIQISGQTLEDIVAEVIEAPSFFP